MNNWFTRQSLYARLALVLFLSFMVLGVFSVGLLMRSSRAYQQEVTQVMHRDIANYVVDHYLLFKEGEPDVAAVEHTFHDLMILGPNFEFYLLDTRGRILAYSADPTKIKREKIALEAIQRFSHTTTQGGVIYGDDPRSLTRKKVFSAAPIYNDDTLAGYLYVILGSEIYDDIASMVSQSQIIKWGVWLFIAGLGFALLTMLWVTGLFTGPLTKLTQQIKQLQQTGFSQQESVNEDLEKALQRWHADSNNEIHSLGYAFAQLIDKLNQQYTNVLTIDQLRKELLSHVSHDLRTPLASLLGYLETWEINRESLSEQQSTEYIAIARKSAERVSKLVEQLFELAHLDSGTVQVNREPFSLPELVQDVLQKFEISAREKQLTLAMEPRNGHIRVVGDIEKLERVFSNLIENAIRHTNPGGTVKVCLNPEHRTVAVEVTDNGIGIPEADVPHVFEAHFKAGNSVRGNTAHGGLGLAITKKLLDLHQSTIHVTSRENQGTTFQFMLETAQY